MPVTKLRVDDKHTELMIGPLQNAAARRSSMHHKVTALNKWPLPVAMLEAFSGFGTGPQTLPRSTTPGGKHSVEDLRGWQLLHPVLQALASSAWQLSCHQGGHAMKLRQVQPLHAYKAAVDSCGQLYD